MSAAQRIERFTLKSGRRLAVRFLVDGEPGKIVFLCHPTPGAGKLLPNLEETLKRGATLISVDRVGYGQSDSLAGDGWISVGEAAEDLAEIVENVATEPIGIAGWSLGGWVALALAARRPNLVDRAAIIGTPTPENEQPWMLPELKEALGLPELLDQKIVSQNLGDYFSNNSVADLGRTLLRVSDADEQILALPDVSEKLTEMIEESFAHGTEGLRAEFAGFNLLPWGFEPASVQAKTLCLYAAKDPLAAHRHGSWWQKQLPDARLEMVPKVGHLLIFPMWKRVLSHLFPRQKKTK